MRLWPAAIAALVMGVAPLLWLNAIDPAVQARFGSSYASLPARWWANELYHPVRMTAPGFADYIRILPELVLSVFGIVIMLLDPLLDEDSSQQTLGGIALVGSARRHLATLYPVATSWYGFLEYGAG